MSHPPSSSPWGPPGSSNVADDPGRWGRWQSRPRWQRWSIYGAAGFVVLMVIAAVADDPNEDADQATTDSSTATTQAAASASSATTVATTTTIETTTTTSTTTTSTTVPGSLLALDVLAVIAVENEQSDGYDRDLFSYGDVTDDRGCRTRSSVLTRDSLTPAQIDPAGCAVVAGDWYSAHDGLTWTDPAELDIDHVVGFKEAWDSGAWGWDAQRRSAFGNDLEDARSLRAVTDSVNQSKGSSDPSNWIPPNNDFVCTYLADWTSIKARWGLSMGSVRTRPHQQPAHGPMPQPGDRAVARHAASGATSHTSASRA
jgi:hypothetical protein